MGELAVTPGHARFHARPGDWVRWNVAPATATLPDGTTVSFSRTVHGFDGVDIRDAPDRPGKELVFLARRCRRLT